MPDDLYTDDILHWSGQQAALLRRLANGERVNDAIDWENVIEEVESVGRSELTAVRTLLRRALEHMLKVHAWPAGPGEHWRGEILTFLGDAADRWTPSMRRHIDLPALFARACFVVGSQTIDGRPPRDLPPACPFTLDDLILPPPGGRELAALLAALDRPHPEPD
jgi:hypothetical protein